MRELITQPFFKRLEHLRLTVKELHICQKSLEEIKDLKQSTV